MRMHCKLSLALLAALLLVSCVLAEAQNGNTPIHYTVTLENPAEHLLRVEISVPPGAAQRDFQLPVWNATYQVRDFSEYVRWLGGRETGGASLTVHKLNKSLWRVEGIERGGVVQYEILADQPGPFGAQLNGEHAFFNLAEILMYPEDARSAPVTVKFSGVPEGWRVACALKEDKGELQAADYDTLVDSPVELSKFQEALFSEDGGHYRIVLDASPDAYDLQRLKDTLRKIVHAETVWMQDRPVQDYLFIYHFPPERGEGGMEHAYSTAIELSRRTLRDNPGELASMTAHEFFHLWNVKRIRPQSLAPVDYTKENYTRALWFSEGVTSTVEQYGLLQGGLIDEKAFLRNLGEEITGLQNRPAHLTQSAEESSLDAWLEKYPAYRQPARSISYYNKGFLLGILLDLAMRKDSNNEASLQELFQYLNQTYAKKGRFFDDSTGIRQAAESVSGANLGWFFQKYVAGTEEIPYDDFLAWVGLQVAIHEKILSDAGFRAARNFDAAPAVIQVAPGGEAFRAGLAVGDTILAVDGVPPARNLDAIIDARQPGETLHLRVRSAAGADRELSWKLEAKKTQEYEVVDVENVTSEQLARRKAWLFSAKPTSVTSGAEQPAAQGRQH
jgi:predicted metalloprotease with PDZ domain